MSTKRAVVTLEEGVQARIDIRDFELIADEKLEDGGTNEGATPPELFLASLGACAAITIKLYAQRKGWDLQRVQISMEMDKLDPAEYPEQARGAAFLNRIRKQYAFEGNLDEEQRQRLMEIGGKCPVARVVQNPIIFEDSLVVPSEA
jgi:putative redox protein